MRVSSRGAILSLFGKRNPSARFLGKTTLGLQFLAASSASEPGLLGAFDPTIRKFAITDSGIAVGQPFEGIEAVLSGMARETAVPAALFTTSGDGKPPNEDGQLA